MSERANPGSAEEAAAAEDFLQSQRRLLAAFGGEEDEFVWGEEAEEELGSILQMSFRGDSRINEGERGG